MGGFVGEVLGEEMGAMCFSQFLNQSASGIFQNGHHWLQ